MSMTVSQHFVEEVEISADKFWIELLTTDKDGVKSEVTLYVGSHRSDEEREDMARSLLTQMHNQIGKLLEQ
jgi:hypothetical protein